LELKEISGFDEGQSGVFRIIKKQAKGFISHSYMRRNCAAQGILPMIFSVHCRFSRHRRCNPRQNLQSRFLQECRGPADPPLRYSWLLFRFLLDGPLPDPPQMHSTDVTLQQKLRTGARNKNPEIQNTCSDPGRIPPKLLAGESVSLSLIRADWSSARGRNVNYIGFLCS